MPEQFTHINFSSPTTLRRLLHLLTYVFKREHFFELPFTTQEWIVAMKWEEEEAI